MTHVGITEDEFEAGFTLVPNHLNDHAAWTLGDGPGCLFETYGKEFAFVQRQDPGRVWTLMDGDDGNLLLLSGLHFLNRIGYLITRQAVAEGQSVEVHFEVQIEHVAP